MLIQQLTVLQYLIQLLIRPFTNNVIQDFTSGICINLDADDCIITGNQISTSGSTTGVDVSGSDNIISNNSFPGSGTTGINVAASTVSNEISGNSIDGFTTACAVSSTSNEFVRVGNGNLEEISVNTSSVNGYADRHAVGNTGPTSVSLSDLTRGSAGHKIEIRTNSITGTVTLTPTSRGTDFSTAGAVATYSSITMATGLLRYVILEWNGRAWDIRSNLSSTINP